MKKILALLFCFFAHVIVADAPLELALTAQSFQPLTLLCAVDQTSSAQCQKVAQLCAQLLSSSKQFSAIVKSMALPNTKQQMGELVQQGYAVALFFSGDAHEIFWRLYDVLDVHLLIGKKIGGALADYELAIAISSQVFQALTSQADSFSSLIAACKRLPKKGRTQASLCLVHPFLDVGAFVPITVVGKGNNFGPRWHTKRSVIFYSQHMPTNIRLMSVDTQNISRVITNFDGQNMTPAIAPDGRVVLALSTNNSVQLFNYQFDEEVKKGIFTQLTHEKGDCISPSFLNNDELVFCNIDERNVPRIGILTISAQKVRWVVPSALCPMASPDGREFAFCKRTNGFLQVFIYTVSFGKQRQLTHDTKGHKDECSWSPCGNYIVCSVESGSSSRIVVINVSDGQLRFITPANEYWSSPCWSPALSLPFSFGKSV